MTGIRSAHHWKSMKCLTCFFATSKSTLPSGHRLHTSTYSKDICTGSGVMPANKLNSRSIPHLLELRLGTYQGLPSNVSPTIIPSAHVNSRFRTTSSYVLTLPLVITGTWRPSFKSLTWLRSAGPCRRFRVDAPNRACKVIHELPARASRFAKGKVCSTGLQRRILVEIGTGNVCVSPDTM
jgi:hypothetical protein